MLLVDKARYRIAYIISFFSGGGKSEGRKRIILQQIKNVVNQSN